MTKSNAISNLRRQLNAARTRNTPPEDSRRQITPLQPRTGPRTSSPRTGPRTSPRTGPNGPRRTSPNGAHRATPRTTPRITRTQGNTQETEISNAATIEEKRSSTGTIIDAETGEDLEPTPEEEQEWAKAMDRVEAQGLTVPDGLNEEDSPPIPKVVVPKDEKISIWFHDPVMKLIKDLEKAYHDRGMNFGRIKLIEDQIKEGKFPPGFAVKTVISVTQEFQQRAELKEGDLIDKFNKQRNELLAEFRNAEISQLNVHIDELKAQIDNIYQHDRVKWTHYCDTAKTCPEIPSNWAAWVKTKIKEAKLNGAYKAEEWLQLKVAQANNREAKAKLAKTNGNNDDRQVFRDTRPPRGGRGIGRGRGRRNGIKKQRRH